MYMQLWNSKSYSSSVLALLPLALRFWLFLVPSAESSFIDQLGQFLLDKFVDLLNSQV